MGILDSSWEKIEVNFGWILDALVVNILVISLVSITIKDDVIRGPLIVSTNTGCSDWKLSKVNGCKTEMVHSSPYIGKAKMCLISGRHFQFSKFCSQFTAVYLQFFIPNTLYHLYFTFFLQKRCMWKLWSHDSQKERLPRKATKSGCKV